MKKSLSALLFILTLGGAAGASDSASAGDSVRINPELLARAWSARWISVPGESPFDFGVYHFRRMLDLKSKPSSFVVHVTADNRYQLFVNGARAAAGPARGGLNHWRYETVDIGKYLKAGKNVLAAVVWNFGDLAPMAQTTNQSGFLLQGDGNDERVADTNQSWRCIRNKSYTSVPVTNAEVRGYF